MKRLIAFVALLALITFTGCTPVEEGIYKEGVYFGSVEDTFGGETNVVTAVVYVNESGMIKSVFIDSTYTKDEKLTTKKTLKEQYGMKETSANIGAIPGGAEWYEQVKTLEDKVVEEQGLDWLTWKDADHTKTDSVSGVTINISSLVAATRKALDQAK